LLFDSLNSPILTHPCFSLLVGLSFPTVQMNNDLRGTIARVLVSV
jgi:hypothetical protein